MQYVANTQKTGKEEARCTHLQRQLTHLEKHVKHSKFKIHLPIYIWGESNGDETWRKEGEKRDQVLC